MDVHSTPSSQLTTIGNTPNQATPLLPQSLQVAIDKTDTARSSCFESPPEKGQVSDPLSHHRISPLPNSSGSSSIDLMIQDMDEDDDEKFVDAIDDSEGIENSFDELTIDEDDEFVDAVDDLEENTTATSPSDLDRKSPSLQDHKVTAIKRESEQKAPSDTATEQQAGWFSSLTAKISNVAQHVTETISYYALPADDKAIDGTEEGQKGQVKETELQRTNQDTISSPTLAEQHTVSNLTDAVHHKTQPEEGFFSSCWNTIKSTASVAYETLKEGSLTAYNSVTSTASAAYETAKEKTYATYEQAKAYGAELGSTLGGMAVEYGALEKALNTLSSYAGFKEQSQHWQEKLGKVSGNSNLSQTTTRAIQTTMKNLGKALEEAPEKLSQTVLAPYLLDDSGKELSTTGKAISQTIQHEFFHNLVEAQILKGMTEVYKQVESIQGKVLVQMTQDVLHAASKSIKNEVKGGVESTLDLKKLTEELTHNVLHIVFPNGAHDIQVGNLQSIPLVGDRVQKFTYDLVKGYASQAVDQIVQSIATEENRQKLTLQVAEMIDSTLDSPEFMQALNTGAGKTSSQTPSSHAEEASRFQLNTEEQKQFNNAVASCAKSLIKTAFPEVETVARRFWITSPAQILSQSLAKHIGPVISEKIGNFKLTDTLSSLLASSMEQISQTPPEKLMRTITGATSTTVTQSPAQLDQNEYSEKMDRLCGNISTKLTRLIPASSSLTNAAIQEAIQSIGGKTLKDRVKKGLLQLSKTFIPLCLKTGIHFLGTKIVAARISTFVKTVSKELDHEEIGSSSLSITTTINKAVRAAPSGKNHLL